MQSESKKSRRVHGSRNRPPEQSHQHGLNQASENSQLLNSKNRNSKNRNSENCNSKLKPISEHRIQRIEEQDKNGRHNFPGIMFETKATDQDKELQINEDVTTSDFVGATYDHNLRQ
ncbi:hypothetical protein LXL04_017128 [Taraxacum kok-saghyz]